MTHTYEITGMTCNGCVAKVKSKLLAMPDVLQADVQLASPQATITMQGHISTSELQSILSSAGNYKISDINTTMSSQPEAAEDKSWLALYKPVLLVFAYITGITVIAEVQRDYFAWHEWMPNFMAGFFLVFSFFKLINLRAFAESYSMYDIVAKQWNSWGYIYAFAELALGIAFLLRFNPILTNAATLVLMSVSIIGVLQSVLNKRQIRCACLGAVFNLPMSTITIIEDALMIAMSAIMLFQMM